MSVGSPPKLTSVMPALHRQPRTPHRQRPFNNPCHLGRLVDTPSIKPVYEKSNRWSIERRWHAEQCGALDCIGGLSRKRHMKFRRLLVEPHPETAVDSHSVRVACGGCARPIDDAAARHRVIRKLLDLASLRRVHDMAGQPPCNLPVFSWTLGVTRMVRISARDGCGRYMRLCELHADHPTPAYRIVRTTHHNRGSSLAAAIITSGAQSNGSLQLTTKRPD